jgi:MAE_28990/MAE_18760-like HEPN
MTTADLSDFFEERFAEIKSYLDLLQNLEEAIRNGSPRLEGSQTVITASQQKILYSSVYLQLYNLVEATVSRCINEISEAATSHPNAWRVDDLIAELKKEWVRSIARTHTDLTPDNRLQDAMAMCDHLIARLPIAQLKIDMGGGGNWDDEEIFRISKRIGCELQITSATTESVKRPLRDNMGAMKLVKARRNRLAHGQISFVECAEGIVVAELRDITNVIGGYLREAISCFSEYIDLCAYVLPERRPQGAA